METSGLEFRVQRDIDGARLQDPEVRADVLEGVVHEERNAIAGFHAGFDQEAAICSAPVLSSR